MESPPLEYVNPVRPVAPWVGGKRSLSRQLVSLIGRTPHGLYAEPFVGMGGVFLRRDRRPRAEVINDISADVATLFRILQRHYQAFLDTLKWQLASRAEWDRLMRTDPTTLTDLERSARFLYLQRLAFGGKVRGRSFGVSYGPSRFDMTKLVPMLEEVHERLAGVTIERLPFADFIRRYDRPETLFFLDPPYWGNERDYGDGLFSEADFELLRGLLEACKGRFILTINDRPETRKMFGQFKIEPVTVLYRLSGGATPAGELVITSPKSHT
ncbi:DNA adenine methylase [Polymorphobacter sp.]|uniref:DNA adenine methylase n=1 Tax=Polymorphobacter sp. TaxID=1909290 RepID=UPI003F708769